MSELFGELTGSLPFVVGVLLVAVSLLALLLLVLLNRARDAARYADLEAGRPARDGTEGSALEVLDLRTSPSESEMKETAQRALELIGQVQPGGQGRYEVPWFLALGQTASGKTTLLANTGLRPPFGEPDETEKGCLWWLFDRAVVLDVAGDLVLRLDTATSDQPAWRALLELVRQSRPKRPIDGVLLTLPLPQLLTFDPAKPTTQTALAHQAEQLRLRLEEVRRTLGVEFPVFTVVTQCDRLPGFSDYVAALEPGEAAQMFGWSVRTSPAIAYSDGWVDDAFASVGDALDRSQLRAIQDGKVPAEPRAWLALPATLAALREPVRIFWSQIFGGGTLDAALPVRGLYFASGVGFESEGADRHPPVPGYRTFEGGSETGRHHRVDFVADLFARKILFEWSLARPIKAVARRAYGLRSGLQVALAATLILGPLAVAYAHHKVAEEADALRCRFLIPARCALARTPLGARPTRESALAVLNAIQPVPSYTLRSSVLPTSWWNRYVQPVRQTAIDAYGRVVFPALAQALDRDLANLAVRPVPAGSRTARRDLASRPGFGELNSFVQEVARLDGQVHVYQEVAPGTCGVNEEALLAHFQNLVRDYAPEVPVQPPSSAESFYESVLCLAEGPEFPHDAHKRALGKRALDLSGTALDRLFSDNVVRADLLDLQSQIDDLARTAPPASEVNSVYGELVAAIERTRTNLPEATLSGKAATGLTASFRQLTDQVARVDLLGPGVAKAMEEQAAAGLEGFREDLAAYTTEATGPLLAQEKGVAQAQLSSSVLGLETALRSLLKGFTQPRQGPPFQASPPPGTYLAWNFETLQRAVKLNDDYVNFMSKSFADLPGFQPMVRQSSRQSVEENVLDLVAQAQSFPSRPELAGSEQRETFLAAQVENLGQAAAPLNSLLGSLRKPSTEPPPARRCSDASALAYCRLGRALRRQELDLADQLERLRADLALYSPVAGAFADWEGGAGENLAWRAFGVEDAAGLTAYLTNQRRILETLAGRYAGPIVTDVPLGSDVGDVSSPAIRTWNLIQSDLADYKNKVPGNALQALESYVSGGMGTATAASCLSLPAGSGDCFSTTTPAKEAADAPPCDPILAYLGHLQAQVEPRCTQLNYDEGVLAYGRIKGSFDRRLAGRFPFASAAEDAPDEAARSTRPEDLDAFFKDFDAEKGKVESLLAASALSRKEPRALPASPWSEGTENRVRQFLEDMGKVRAFFALYLDREAAPAAGEAAPGAGAPASTPAPAPGAAAPASASAPRLPRVPAFGVRVDFRPRPSAEEGGNEVIARGLTGGDVSLSLTSPPPASPPVWQYGTPLQLTLRWAKDSLAVPQPATAASGFTVADRTVTWTFADRWSLLQLVLAAKDQPNGAERRLVLRVPVQAAKEVPGSTERGAPPIPAPVSPATLFLDVTLTTPDTSRTELAVPDFPAKAPEGS